ncbi:MAG: VTT domain-containing protein [Pseudomonadota bacterium]|nr:VTT domain-containing protein [Pseudomonadota bacterium]
MRFYFLVLLIGAIILSGVFFDYLGFTLDLVRYHHKELSMIVEESFLIAIILFTALYFFSTVFSLPLGASLTLVGGYLFNIFYGFIAVIIGATLGALTLFIFVRAVSLKTSNKIYIKSEILSRIKAGIEKDLWGDLFFIRFFPIFPFWLVNIAPAILGLRLLPYLITTFLGIMPGTLFIIILGSGIDDILSTDLKFSQVLFENKVFLLSLLALSCLAIFPVIYKKLERK